MLGSLRLSVLKSEVVERKVWMFSKANWDGLRAKLRSLTWNFFSSLAVDEAALALTQTILDAVSDVVPQRFIQERKSTHPWINERVLSLVENKHEMVGTDREEEARDACSKGLLEEFCKFVQREKHRLANIRRGSKAWWSISSRLLQHKGAVLIIYRWVQR